MPESESRSGRVFARSVGTVLLISVLTTVALLGLAELYLRVVYSDGLSFGNHRGPYVRRFEQDFHYNRFDGPSRGPEVAGPRGEDTLRVLIQGDSITCGQGVKDESRLFSSLLQDRLHALRPDAEVAALAYPGREIDGHLAQLSKWGDEIDPNIIVYQWYITDIELDKSDRPRPGRTWQRFVFPDFEQDFSYLSFLLNYRIGTPSTAQSYEDYVAEDYALGTEKWHLFTEQFRRWAAEAKRLTPNVLVILYPDILPTGVQLGALHDRMRALAQERLAVLDLRQPFEVFSDGWTQTYASQFDGHPNQTAHERIAEALYDRIGELWPELIGPASGDEGHV